MPLAPSASLQLFGSALANQRDFLVRNFLRLPSGTAGNRNARGAEKNLCSQPNQQYSYGLE